MKRGLRDSESGLEFSHDPLLRLPSAIRFTEEQVLAFLRRIQSPTLLIRARSGWPADPQKMRTRVEAIPNCTVLEVDGKHHVHLDAPLSVAEELVRHFTG